MRRRGRGVLLLVPEIALTPAVALTFRQAFGERVAIQHSGLSDGERHDQWHRIRRGDVDVVVGTRSAVFAPLRAIGLVIVDEEHDGSYKQEETPRYNGRDVAVMRAREAGALAVLGSATPSMESYQNAQKGRYTLVTLNRRVLDRPLADVRIVDMREEYAAAGPDVVLSATLCDAMGETLSRGEQAIVLLNRRGFRQLRLLPAMRLDARVPELQPLADRASRRPPRALPLLQPRDPAAEGVRQLLGQVHRARRVRHRARRSRSPGAVPRGARRARRPRHDPQARRDRGAPRAGSRRASSTSWWARR